MDIESYRSYCLNKPGVTEEFPFDSETLVFKVKGKMFALTDITLFRSVNLKCDPEKAVERREHYEEVSPGYHMSKIHWNTVSVQGTLPDHLIQEWTDESYELVVRGLPKKLRNELGY